MCGASIVFARGREKDASFLSVYNDSFSVDPTQTSQKARLQLRFGFADSTIPAVSMLLHSSIA
jgi:hypothetical protein